MDRRMWCESTIVAVCALIAGCATAPRWQAYSPPPMGSTWATEFRNTGSYANLPTRTEGRMAEVVWKGKPHLAFQGTGGTIVAQRDGAWVALLAPDGKPTVTFDPPTPYTWPLEVGKTFQRSFKSTNHMNNQTVDVRTTDTVEAYEEVTVPAGKFMAYRIRTVDNQGADNTIWFSPQTGIFVKQKLTRTAAAPQGPGTRESELVVWKAAR